MLQSLVCSTIARAAAALGPSRLMVLMGMHGALVFGVAAVCRASTALQIAVADEVRETGGGGVGGISAATAHMNPQVRNN